MSPIPSTVAAPLPPSDDVDGLDESDDAVADASGPADGEDAATGSLTIADTGFSTVSQSTTNFYGDADDVTLYGSDGDDTVNVHGEFSGTIDGGLGDDGVIAHAGSVIVDSEIRGGEGDDGVIQNEGRDLPRHRAVRRGRRPTCSSSPATTRGPRGSISATTARISDRIRLMPTVTGDSPRARSRTMGRARRQGRGD